jgi:hypothetical protein
MPDVRQLRKDTPVRPIAKLTDINSAVNRIVACGTQLDNLRRRIGAVLNPETI